MIFTLLYTAVVTTTLTPCITSHLYEQSACVHDPSKVQAGGTQCAWDPDQNACTQVPAPATKSFTILVSLLTTILSTPILVAVTYVLNEHASVWPGSRGIEDDVGKDGEDAEIDELGAMTDEVVDTATILRNSTRKSDFGDLIKRAVSKGGLTGKDQTAEVVRLAYAGKQSRSTLLSAISFPAMRTRESIAEFCCICLITFDLPKDF